MHLDISQQPLYMEIYRKSAWKPRRRLCASLRSRSASQHFRRATLYGNLQVKCRRPNRGPHLARACTVEMHSEISQEPLYTEICRKNAAAQLEHPDQAPAFTLIVRTPQCGHRHPLHLGQHQTHHFRQHPEITQSSHFGRSLWATRISSLWATRQTSFLSSLLDSAI